jgi:two-component system probable response regulator PhcQ
VDVVVSDEQMTGISGTELLRKVRLSYPGVLRFILTGKATVDTAVRAINEGGVCRFFLKPCHAIELVVAIRQELEKRDLIVASQHLLQKVKLQAVQIENLEKEYGEIAKVCRDVDGTILLEDVPEDVSDLVTQIWEQFGNPTSA